MLQSRVLNYQTNMPNRTLLKRPFEAAIAALTEEQTRALLFAAAKRGELFLVKYLLFYKRPRGHCALLGQFGCGVRRESIFPRVGVWRARGSLTVGDVDATNHFGLPHAGPNPQK